MSGNASGHRQRAVMASDAEWEIIGQVAKRGGMDRSRYLIHRALMPDALPTEVLRRAVRELLVLSLVEERRLREAGAGQAWEDIRARPIWSTAAKRRSWRSTTGGCASATGKAPSSTLR